MKTLTITLHDTENCGSSLQAFALQYFLKSNGIENEIINYVPHYTRDYGHPIKNFVWNIFFLKSILIRRKKFKEFIRKYLKLTSRKYTTVSQLRRYPPQADWYIAGSDQLWNTMFACGRDPAFYLDFAQGRKLGYAVSMGRERIPEDNLDMIRKYAGEFEGLSVREKTSVKEVEKAYGKHVEYVCDPVLLHSVEIYDQIRCKRIFSEPYILVYVAQKVEPQMLDRWVKRVNSEGKLMVVFIGAYRQMCRCDYHIRDISPSEFVSLISYADYVVSNSFHATLFSLLYHRQFVTIVPEENGKRMESILVEVGLKNHAVTVLDAVPERITEQNYVQIDNKLREFSRKSGAWLLATFNE